MDSKQKEEIATQRLQAILPLLDRALDKAKRLELLPEVSRSVGRSQRTIRRWLNCYQKSSYEGLKPRDSEASGKTVIDRDVLDEAIRLRREVPRRSVKELISIMELNQTIEPNSVKRSTLQEQLTRKGYSSRQMIAYACGASRARRYQKPWRNYVWQSDIKYGFSVAGRPTYMVCFMDDCSRNIMHSEFYDTLNQSIVFDAFRKAVTKFGVPEKVYFDNGKQYRNRVMHRICSKLGIQLLYAAPYSPQGKGKQERYNQTVDSFLREAQLQKPKSLAELNKYYNDWMEAFYITQPHAGLDGKTPREVYDNDSRPLKFVMAEDIARAFLFCETRKVDKSGCISFQNQKYEVELGLEMIYKRVDVVYDPLEPSEVTIECRDFPACKARPLVIGRNSPGKNKLPERLTSIPAQKSELLEAAAKKAEELQSSGQRMAISFASLARNDEASTAQDRGDK